MKKMKKIIALAVAMAMVFAMSLTAFAEGETTYKITIENKTAGHTYSAYPIFTGDLSTNTAGKKVLSNIQWGTGITDDGQKALLAHFGITETDGKKALSQLVDEMASETNVKAIASIVATSGNLGEAAGSASTVGENGYVISDLTPGYYLVTDSLTDGSEDFVSDYIVKVVGNATAKPKGDKPSVDKQVQDETADAEAGADTYGWGETADHAINESFQFKLKATLPNTIDYASYTNGYTVTFTDTMSKGVTFENIVSVKIDGQDVPLKGAGDDDRSGKYATTATNGMTAAAGEESAEWTLTIDDITKITGVDLTDGATIEVIYNAHLNENAVVGNTPDNNNKVGLEYSNNPNATGTGKTPEDTVWVFTYEMDNKKVDGDSKPLAGAGFRLYSDEDCTNEVKLIKDGDVYRPVKVDADGNPAETSEEMFSAEETGVFNIKGLDAGTYYLKETTTPAGYNTCDNIVVIISATHAEVSGGTSATTKITMTQDGTQTDINTIINNSGAVLPETGGIGTTIFYVVGAILMIGAGVMLVTRKRISK